MNEGDDKTSASFHALAPRRKLAAILVVMLFGVLIVDPPFLRETPKAPAKTEDLAEIDALLAEFDNPQSQELADAPPFDAGNAGADSPAPAVVQNSSPLIIPSENSEVPVQTVSLPEPSHEPALTVPMAAMPSAAEPAPAAPVEVTQEPGVSIRLTGSIFPTP